ncbi:MAG: hypothetical protein J7M34_06475, partial [Anaerolineae bacterium]|nr:hypothetical protein [Anaerolineae bacterium]
MHTVPLLVSLLVGAILGLVTWERLRTRRHGVGRVLMETRDELLIGLLILAALAVGVFVTYILLVAGS